MKKLISIIFSLILAVGLLSYVSIESEALTAQPFKVANGLYNQSRNYEDLGLSKVSGAEVVKVYKASANTDKFCNGVVMTEFKGKLYCQWQSSARDEDTADTWVAYSVSSDDGATWSEPMVLAESIENGYCSSGGWYVNGNTIVGYINVWPDDVSPRGGYTYYTQSTDGENWTEPAPVLMKDGSVLNGIFEQDPHVLGSGRIVSAAHFQTGLFINPVYTDDKSGVNGWVKAEYTNMSQSGSATTSREMEPSMFVNEDGNLVMIFRDQDSSYKVLASVSTDQGETWSDTVLTNMPDSRQKQSAGNLPDGTAYIVGCPVNNKLRLPLAITLSADGKNFDKAYVLGLGSEAPTNVVYAGKAKRQGYHYPKSAVLGDYLYVSYAKNKESVEYVRIPLSAISLNSGLATMEPTIIPTVTPTIEPTATPTIVPTSTPIIEPTIVPTDTPAPTVPEFILGDVNADGNIDAADALLVLKYAAKLSEIDDVQILAANTAKDDSIDANDALQILKYAAKLIESF